MIQPSGWTRVTGRSIKSKIKNNVKVKIPWPWGNAFDDVIAGFTEQINTLRGGTKLKYWSKRRHCSITETLKQVQVILTTNIWSPCSGRCESMVKTHLPFSWCVEERNQIQNSLRGRKGEHRHCRRAHKQMSSLIERSTRSDRLQRQPWEERAKRKTAKTTSLLICEWVWVRHQTQMAGNTPVSENQNKWNYTGRKIKFKAHQDIKP